MQLKIVFAVAMTFALSLHCYGDDFTEEELKAGKAARTDAIKTAADKVDALEKAHKQAATPNRKKEVAEEIKQAKKEYNEIKKKSPEDFAAEAKNPKAAAAAKVQQPLPPNGNPFNDPGTRKPQAEGQAPPAGDAAIDPELLFIPGDLHEAWEAGPLAAPPKMFEALPPARRQGDRRLMRRGKVRGGITAFQWDDAADAADAYDIILKGMGGDTEVLDGVGDQARTNSWLTKSPPGLNMPDFVIAEIVFLRGKTVAHIRLSDMKPEEITPLAKKIDARIQK
jgi:hypothetical protein